MTAAARAAEHARAIVRFEAARPAWGAGVRAALATVVPLLAGQALGLPAVAWISLGGYTVALADPGGAYSTRALAMVSVALLGPLSAAIGATAGATPAVAIPLLLVWGVLCSFARVYGAAGNGAGLSILVMYLASMAAPSPALAGARLSGALIGGAWALFLALVAWPIRPFRPARVATSDCWERAAEYAERLAVMSAGARDEEWTAVQGTIPARVRDTLERARATLAAVRRGRAGESRRGERLLVLLESADQCFATLAIAAELLRELGAREDFAAARAAAARALAAFAADAREIARLALRERPDRAASPSPSIETTELRAALGALPAETAASTGAQQMTQLLARLREFLSVAAGAALGLAGEERLARAVAGAYEPTLRSRFAAPVAENLSGDSVLLRHALRVGIGLAGAQLLAERLHLVRGYWVTLTVLVCLQPYLGATFYRALQRVTGTVVGALLAALLGRLVHTPLGITLIAAPLIMAFVAVLPLNYGLYSVLVTPTFVLLAEVDAGDWHLAHLRALNTVIGGAIALIATRALWPSPERARAPDAIGDALAAVAAYLTRICSAPPGHGDPAARRAAGLAVSNGEASLQRLLTEARGSAAADEAAMTLLSYARRLTGTITALADSGGGGGWPGASVAGRLADALAAAAAAVRHREHPPRLDAPPPLPSAPALASDELLRRGHLERLARQVAVVHDAAARWAT